MNHPAGTAEGTALTVYPVSGLPEITAGAALADLILDALTAGGLTVRDGDVLVVSSKVIAKALGLRIPAEQRTAAVLQQSSRVVAERLGNDGLTRIVEAHAGPVMAAAGIDASNTGPAHIATTDPASSPNADRARSLATDMASSPNADRARSLTTDPASSPNTGLGGSGPAGQAGPVDTVLLLPRDPDAAAGRLRDDLRAALARSGGTAATFGVVISDTAGRPWRAGQVDFALGAAGVQVMVDHREQLDDDGRSLRVTARAVADALAAAADLVKGKTRRVPAALVRGAGDLVLADGDDRDGARALVRTGRADWFAYGHLEAVRAALGVAPGTQAAVEVGIAPANADRDTREARIARACAVALFADGLGDLPSYHPRAHLMRDRTDLSTVRAQLIQYGLRLEAPEPFALGVAVGRLLAALAVEGVPARLAEHDDTPTRSGRARASALVIFA